MLEGIGVARGVGMGQDELGDAAGAAWQQLAVRPAGHAVIRLNGHLGRDALLMRGRRPADADQMRRWLRERPHGAAQVLRSAMQHLERRPMTKVQKAEFWKAYRYLRRHRRLMDYQGYRRRGLPIGSGVTEAACKTVFTQRFKRSGMLEKAIVQRHRP